jgi:hypothetical protein
MRCSQIKMAIGKLAANQFEPIGEEVKSFADHACCASPNVQEGSLDCRGAVDVHLS